MPHDDSGLVRREPTAPDAESTPEPEPGGELVEAPAMPEPPAPKPRPLREGRRPATPPPTAWKTAKTSSVLAAILPQYDLATAPRPSASEIAESPAPVAESKPVAEAEPLSSDVPGGKEAESATAEAATATAEWVTTTAVWAPVAPAIDLRSDVAGVAESGAVLRLATPAVAIDRWSLEEVRGRLFVVVALLAYLAALATAELAVVYGSPVLVFPLHGGLVVVAMLHLALRARRRVDGTARDPLGPALLALMLGPLIRIISLTLPLGQIEPAYRYVAAGVPMVVAGVAALWLSGMRPADVGLRLTRPSLQVWVALAALPLGLVEYLILRPQPLGTLPWEAAGLLPALAVGLSTGFPEELIFRGVLQTAVRPILGAWNWVYVSAVFAVLHIGYQSPVDLVFVLLVGSFYGLVFERTRSIVGVSVSHGLANAILFFVAPNLPWLVALRIGPF